MCDGRLGGARMETLKIPFPRDLRLVSNLSTICIRYCGRGHYTWFFGVLCVCFCLLVPVQLIAWSWKDSFRNEYLLMCREER